MSQETFTLDLGRLRRETAAEHAAVEESMPLMESSLTRGEYVQCLRRMYGIVAAWEEVATAQAPPWLRAMLVARQRRYLLDRDLDWFGVTEREHDHAALPAMDSLASLLGTMYVMEGSTLGGQLIARHVGSVLELEPGRGDAFFRGHGPATGAMWREFCEVLRTKVADEESAAMIRAAQSMFWAYGKWMRQDLTLSNL